MSLEKGFLRRPELLLTKLHKFWAVVIYAIVSFATHLLFTLCVESFHIIYNLGKWFEYKTLDDTYRFYSWFIAGFSACAGLSFSLRFILRSKLNSLSVKKRFNKRLSYHFIGLTFWSNISFISRLGHIFTFFFIIFFTDSFYTMKSIYGYIMILMLAVSFLNNWLMAHRVLRKDYFKYVFSSFLIVCITTWTLVNIKSLNFTYYNQYVASRSVHANEHFDIIEGFSVQRQQYLNGPRLYMRPKPDSSFPEITYNSWQERKVLSESEVHNISYLKENYFQLLVDKKVKLEQVLNFQKLYQHLPNFRFEYRAMPKQDSISQAYFEYYSYTIWQSINYNEDDNLQSKLKGKEAIFVSINNGQYLIGSEIVSPAQVSEKVTAFYLQYKHQAVVLLKPDTNASFGEYITLLDIVKISIINLQKAYMREKYDYDYIHHLPDSYHEDSKRELNEAKTKYPLHIHTIALEELKHIQD